MAGGAALICRDADLYAQCNTGAPDRTVIARPFTSLSLEDR
ncbi:MAG TPA: hypothetical protein VIJ23_01495 [Mycobacterium sp.]